jgi:threonine/homoserine/homoserine lactone efflux protein
MGVAIRDGLILGITLSTLFGFGPALLALLQISLSRGFKSGFALAFGIFLSDFFMVMLTFKGVTKIIEEPSNKIAFGIGGGLVLMVFGIFTFLKKPKLESEEIKVEHPKTMAFIVKGFLLNIANPFVWLFWMGTMIAVSSNYEQDKKAIILVFSIALLTVLISDFTKSFLSDRLKPLITARLLTIINRIAGIGLFLFGISIIYRAF